MTGRWSTSVRSALRHRVVQVELACALLVPMAATVGQYWASGFWVRSTAVGLLFWPGQGLGWFVPIPVWLSMGAMLTSYVVGISWLLRKRTLSIVVLWGIGAMMVASLAGAAVNAVTGWKELQTLSSMDLAGKVNQAIFSLWHNPIWEEIVFRGVPLALLLLVQGRKPQPARWTLWSYYLVPSLAFAAYHVPGHGPSRLVDTFILGLAFAWMALRYTFFAPLVMHYVFDAVMTLSLGRAPNVPALEVTWLTDHAAALNSSWSIALLLWVSTILIMVLVFRGRMGRSVDVTVP